jgi:hypothetical protein
VPFSITTANGVVITVYDVHPVAELFPMIAEGEDYEKLKADIKARGVDQPVVFWRDPVTGRNVLLDGRNRIKMSRELDCGLKGTFISADTDPVAYIISANLHRRHLTRGQRADLALKLSNMERGDNRFTIDRPKGPSTSEQPSTSPPPTPKISQKEAGRKFDVSPTEMKKLKWLQKHAPDLAEKVTTGGMKIGTAMTEAEKRGLKPQSTKAQSHSNGSKRSSKPVPKTTETIQHHGDGNAQHRDLAKKLDPLFDALWLGLEPRENAAKIENVLAERNIIAVSDRKRDPRKWLRDLQEKAPKAKGDLAAAWKIFEATWNASGDNERNAFAKAHMKNEDTAFCKLVNMGMEAVKAPTVDSGRQKGNVGRTEDKVPEVGAEAA